MLYRVVASDRVIDVERLDQRLKALYTYILVEFPWVRVSESVHSFLAHSAELIRNNDNTGLGSFSEQGSEGREWGRGGIAQLKDALYYGSGLFLMEVERSIPALGLVLGLLDTSAEVGDSDNDS